MDTMNDEQLLRYSRQIMLPEIDAGGQARLADAHVAIIGLGGLGSAASVYLATGGVGRLSLVDFDKVDLSNLQRQIVHGTADIGRLKVESARDRLLALNPEVRIELLDHAPAAPELDALARRVDVIVDASDNFDTRFAINAACVANRTPLVSAAAIRFEAQVSVFNTAVPGSPCYRCLYTEDAATDQSCTANGVIAPLLGIIGSMQALETMKLVMGIGEVLTGRLLLFDALAMEWRTAKLNRDPDCPVCGDGERETAGSAAGGDPAANA